MTTQDRERLIAAARRLYQATEARQQAEAAWNGRHRLTCKAALEEAFVDLTVARAEERNAQHQLDAELACWSSPDHEAAGTEPAKNLPA